MRTAEMVHGKTRRTLRNPAITMSISHRTPAFHQTPRFHTSSKSDRETVLTGNLGADETFFGAHAARATLSKTELENVANTATNNGVK